MNKKTSLNRQDYWKSHVIAFQRSGFTQKKYCRQQKISYWSFNSWKRRLDRTDITKLQEIPVETIQQLKSTNLNKIDVILNNNIRISIPSEFSEYSLQKIFNIIGVRNEN